MGKYFFRKKFTLAILTCLHFMECLELDWTIFGKCLSVCESAYVQQKLTKKPNKILCTKYFL